MYIFSLVGFLFFSQKVFGPICLLLKCHMTQSRPTEESMSSSLCYYTVVMLFRTFASHLLMTQFTTRTFGLIIPLPLDLGHLKERPQHS